MHKVTNFLKLIFYVGLLILTVVSIFPGSLIGFLVFGDFGRPPNLVDNPFYQVLPSNYHEFAFLINHFASFFFISIFGFGLYLKSNNFKKIIYIFLFLSIFLEIIQLVIPNRAFEIYDIFANFLGVLFAYSVAKFYLYWNKK